MEFLYPKRRRGPEWKQGWTSQTLGGGSVSSPPPQLLTIFGIVIILLWFSHVTAYEAQIHNTTTKFQLVLFLLPILLLFFMSLYSSSGFINFRFRQLVPESTQRGAMPWRIVILLPLILVLLYYQSSFHS